MLGFVYVCYISYFYFIKKYVCLDVHTIINLMVVVILLKIRFSSPPSSAVPVHDGRR